jgi:hypothetical protein
LRVAGELLFDPDSRPFIISGPGSQRPITKVG